MNRRTGRFRSAGTVAHFAALGGLACCVLFTATALTAQDGDNDAETFLPGVNPSSWFGAWSKTRVLGVALWQLIAAFILLLTGLALRKISDHIFEKRLIPLLEKTRFSFDGLLAKAASKPVGYLVLLAGVSAAVVVLGLPEKPNVRAFAYGALKVLFAADLLWFLFRMVDVLVDYLLQLAQRTESKLDDQLIPLIRKALKITIGIICAVWVVQLLGGSVSSLIAGLGIGGLAVALALQDTLANFFGSVFIFLDRPFGVGDRIKMGDVEGTVEDIGFRSTRIRTYPATLVSVPNKTIANASIDNWSKMPKRRVRQVVGVTYETTADEMEQAVAAVRKILETDEGVDQEFMVVRFDDFGESSLNIVVMYFTRDIDYAAHMETKERVNLAMMRALERLSLSIAFPTQTVYFEGDIAKGMTGSAEKPPRPNSAR